MSLVTPSTVRALPPATWGRVRQSRRTADRVMKVTAAGFTFLAIFVLFWILGMLVVKGLGGLSVATFTQITPGPGSTGGGLANAMLGSLVLTFLGIVVATPIGVLAGTYLAEYGKGSKLADLIRFINDILLSA
ncbi:MAG: phosphate ABC transporter permease PtsA, partial [Beijerinckiaceae bacterium]|nr:phosphate ABC transporter permease PtsA [Beijerinckiaceae bacterium]